MVTALLVTDNVEVILRQAIERLPGGSINVDDPRVVLPPKTAAMNDMESMIHHFKVVMEGVRAPVGESWFSVESSKGELGMYVVSDGGSKPVRWRVRGPSFVNMSALPRMVEGHLVADVIAARAVENRHPIPDRSTGGMVDDLASSSPLGGKLRRRRHLHVVHAG
jgi:NADH:ubiquinone oxidoreductase subunit D